ncbi:concanavalin A-like lectin/glucanase domain-containing protein, partial [Gigaspora rosea]
IIAIGFCTKSAKLNKLPGCGENSWGYHSDDGNFFDCSELEEPYGPTFKTSDTIGCCLNFRNNTVLYTKNGVNLGIAFQDLKDLKGNLYPCIGIRSKVRMSIKANFGHKKFKYAEKWIKALEQCDNKDKDMIEDFIKSLEIKQNDEVALRYHAKAYFIMGKYKEVLANSTKLLEIDQNNAFALRYRGETYLILGKYEESSTDLKKLLEIDKNDKWALKASSEINRR